MKTNSNKSADGSKDWSKKEKELIEAIIKCQSNITHLAGTIGECCDKLVQLNKGVQYGDRTLKRIAGYPGINCSEYHLRRCWNFYRLMTNKDYLNADLESLRKKPSAVYHLARIMNSDLPEQDKIDLVRKIAKAAVADNATVNRVAVMVSMQLAGETSGKKQGEPQEPPMPPVTISEKKLQQFAGMIKAVVGSKPLLNESMKNQAVRFGVLSLMNEMINLVDKMPDHCHDNATAKNISELGRRLLSVAERMKVRQK